MAPARQKDSAPVEVLLRERHWTVRSSTTVMEPMRAHGSIEIAPLDGLVTHSCVNTTSSAVSGVPSGPEHAGQQPQGDLGQLDVDGDARNLSKQVSAWITAIGEQAKQRLGDRCELQPVVVPLSTCGLSSATACQDSSFNSPS